MAATFFFDVRTALVLLLCAPVLFAVQRASTAVMSRLDRGRDAAIGESADRVLEYARNQPVLRAFGRTAEGYGALDDALVAEARADRRLIARGLPGLVSFSFATRLVFALLLALGVSWQLDGSLTVPTLLALLVLLVRLIDSVSSAAEAGAGMRIARNTLERLGAVLDEPPYPAHRAPDTPGRERGVHRGGLPLRRRGGGTPRPERCVLPPARAQHEEMEAVCRLGSLAVEEFMAVRARGSVQHLASRVTGALRPGAGPWDAFASLFPAITATGVSKRDALRALARHEPGPRGLYGGAVFRGSTGGALDAALVLRTLIGAGDGVWLRAGAGVTAQSSPEREIEETCEKLRSVAPYLRFAEDRPDTR